MDADQLPIISVHIYFSKEKQQYPGRLPGAPRPIATIQSPTLIHTFHLSPLLVFSTDTSHNPHLYFLTAITRYDLCVRWRPTDSSHNPHLYILTAITRYDLCVSVDAQSYHTSQPARPPRYTSQHQQLASQSVSQWLSSHLLERRVSNKNITSRHGSVHLQFATCCLAPQVNRRCVFSSSAGCYQAVVFASFRCQVSGCFFNNESVERIECNYYAPEAVCARWKDFL